MGYQLTSKSILAKLKANGVRATQQRLKIANLMLLKKTHLTADQVSKLLKQNQENLSKATVYNTLNLFVKIGLVKRVIIEQNKIFFDSNVEDHYHVYNSASGKLTDVKTDQIRILGIPDLPKGVILDGADLTIRVKPK